MLRFDIPRVSNGGSVRRKRYANVVATMAFYFTCSATRAKSWVIRRTWVVSKVAGQISPLSKEGYFCFKPPRL